MNREIKFRGFQPELKKWVFGSLVTMPQGGAWILDYKTGFEDRIRINANTIGQFTGLTDKNGKEIYEGDILSYDDGSEKIQIIYNGNAFEGFRLDRKIFFHNNYLQNKNYLQFNIIGNIHDNPELLK